MLPGPLFRVVLQLLTQFYAGLNISKLLFSLRFTRALNLNWNCFVVGGVGVTEGDVGENGVKESGVGERILGWKEDRGGKV